MTNDDQRAASARRRAKQREARRTQRWIKRVEADGKVRDPKLDRDLEVLRRQLSEAVAEMERRKGNHDPL